MSVGTAEQDAPEPTPGFLLNTCADEAKMNLIYDDHGLKPHYACETLIQANDDGTDHAWFDYQGETWEVIFYNQDSGLAPRDHPDYRNNIVHEYRMDVDPVNDPAEKRGVNYHIAPRWPNPESADPSSPDPSWPDDLLGVNVRAEGAKLPLDAYPNLLRAAADALDINSDYFGHGREHEYSNIDELETYVRADRERAVRVFGSGSPMQRIHELAGRTGDYRKLIEDDRGSEGSMHLTEFTPSTASALIDGHRLGKRPKHYLLRHPPDDPDDPLHHPKVCMLFKKSLNDGAHPWAEPRRASAGGGRDVAEPALVGWTPDPPRRRDLRERRLLQSVRLTATGNIAHRRPDPGDTPGARGGGHAALGGPGVGNPDLNESDTDTLELVADGAHDVSEIARLIETSRRTVYRVVARLSDLLALRGGTVAFASDHLAEKARLGLQATADAFDRDGGSTAEPGPWAKWLNQYGPCVDDLHPDLIELRFGKVPDEWDVRAILRAGLNAWAESGRERRRFEMGIAHSIQDGEGCQEGRKVGMMNLDGARHRRRHGITTR